jgi:hypothetical protein
MNLPRSKRNDVLTTKLEDEVVIYDPETKQAHSLNRVAVAVWNHSEEAGSLDDLQRIVAEEIGGPIDQVAIVGALRKLQAARLLLDKAIGKGPLTRREMLAKSGKLGAAAVVTPLIASALVPAAAAAASQHFTCTTVGVCGNFTFCGPDCACFESDSPSPFCFNDFFCDTAVPCNTHADCPLPGSFCTVNTCCGSLPGFAGFCASACNGSGVPLGPSSGKTATGKTV